MIKESKYALIAGLSLIIMALAAGYSYGFVFTEIFSGEPYELFSRVAEMKSLFTSGVAGWIVIFITDLTVTYSLFIFFRKDNKNLSLITAILRFIYTLILGFGIMKLLSILFIDFANVSDKIFANEQINMYYSSFEHFWSFGLIIFGLHLLGLGVMSLRSRKVPGFIGVLLLLAGFSYTFVHSAKQFHFINESLLQSIEVILSIPMTVGELSLAVWLIIFGIKQSRLSR